MKIVYIAGSRKFADEINVVAGSLRKNGADVFLGRDGSITGEKDAHLEMFRKIDLVDVVYVFAKGGYTGYTVALEIGYAYAKNKAIISSEPLVESGANSLISETIDAKKFVEYCKS